MGKRGKARKKCAGQEYRGQTDSLRTEKWDFEEVKKEQGMQRGVNLKGEDECKGCWKRKKEGRGEGGM